MTHSRPWHGALYPTTLGLALILQHLLLTHTASALLSTYVPIFLAAALITLLEYHAPYRTTWQPTRTDIQQDVLFMGLVQMLLPKLIQFTLTASALAYLHNHHLQPNLWPQDAAIATQVILLLVLVEFFRYWLHRLCHESPLFWRLHQIHHGPKKLYWLNVGRFHPLEKGLQLLLDTLPFVLLGVTETVFSVYFLLYAINGFFQHSNLPIKLGPLNYLISGAELHRWHHAQSRRIAQHNYGNNLIIWDWVFGTFYWPRAQHVGNIGLDHVQSKHFSWFLWLPFKGTLNALQRGLLRAYLTLKMWGLYWRDYVPLNNAAKHPASAQWRALRRILHAQKNTQFGQEHAFQQITSIQQFQASVPIQTYETLRPYIQRQIQQHTAEVTQQAAIMYAQTSGTTGSPKHIPVTAETLRLLRRHQNLLTYQQYQFNPRLFEGKIWGISCAAIEGHLAHHMPYGSASGLIYASLPKFAQAHYIVPQALFSLTDYDLRYRLMLKLALVHENITCLCAANPSTFLRLWTLLNETSTDWAQHFDHLTTAEIAQLPSHLVTTLQTRLRYTPTRRNHVCTQFTQPGPHALRDFWPHIQVLLTWTRGSCGIALHSLTATLPSSTQVIDLGYLASEFAGTVTMTPEQPFGIPLLHTEFFEFVAVHAWEAQRPEFLCLQELQAGQQYYVFITNHAGLYRYHMNDIIEAGAPWQQTPTLAFVQKGQGVTSITGEKMYETHVITAVQHALQEQSLSSPFFLMLANPIDSRYTLYLAIDRPLSKTKNLSECLEKHLFTLNIEYQQKRQSQRLKPLRITRLQPGCAEAYKQHCVHHGQREAQYKAIVLQYQADITFDLDAWAMRPPPEDACNSEN